MAYQTKITRARFVLSPFSSEQMQTIGQVMVDTIRQRILQGKNVNDQPSKPLKPGRNGKKGYPEYKISQKAAPIRDWRLHGSNGTLAALGVLHANENAVTIGFSNRRADLIATVNQRRERAFGVSPSDQAVLNSTLSDMLLKFPLVQAKRVA